ncbi:glutamine-hydrolyzing carbamoyl-phosphate synthase small subunit [[Eubacterium] cellulosolvens]
MKAILVLEDGTILYGNGFGIEGIAEGELVFNTSISGYVEALTDPSYAGQILMMTYPLIGNYGVTDEDYESDRVQVEGFVIRELCKRPSNWRSKKNLNDFLIEHGKKGIEEVDTRMLTKKVRVHGTLKAALIVYKNQQPYSNHELVQMVRNQPHITEQELIGKVSIHQSIDYEVDGQYNVVLVDCGTKRSIINQLLERKMNLHIVPYNYPSRDILEMKPNAVLISNGPGDPMKALKTIDTIRRLVKKIPVAGICLGHQLISLAMGARTFKLKFGHRGSNQPVKDFETGRVFISSQNHGFAVDEKSLRKTGLEITQINLNDRTIEGLKHKELPIIAVQYHPEAGPGPHDTHSFFDEFVKLMER